MIITSHEWSVNSDLYRIGIAPLSRCPSRRCSQLAPKTECCGSRSFLEPCYFFYSCLSKICMNYRNNWRLTASTFIAEIRMQTKLLRHFSIRLILVFGFTFSVGVGSVSTSVLETVFFSVQLCTDCAVVKNFVQLQTEICAVVKRQFFCAQKTKQECFQMSPSRTVTVSHTASQAP